MSLTGVLRRALGVLACVAVASPAAASTSAIVGGEIERITLDAPGDHFAGGVIVVGGQNVVVPRNLLVDLPATRLTLSQLFAEAPPACAAQATTGLARTDPCLRGAAGAFATVRANRRSSGDLIAGEVFIDKGAEQVTGVVTYIDHANGYFRINGQPGSDATGVMVRLNDPQARHTVQQGPGCRPGSDNCSPDSRFGVDPDNYTAAFVTGVPVCLPSIVAGGARTQGSNLQGNGDPLCPQTNRASNVVSDARRFAPLRVGDHVEARGVFEHVDGIRFLSAHHLVGHVALFTRDDPSQPDFIALSAADWNTPPFAGESLALTVTGSTSLSGSQVDVFGRHFDVQGLAHDRPLASTVGNPGFINQGVPPNQQGIFAIRYDVNLLTGVVVPQTAPCQVLRNAGFNLCPLGPSLADEIAVLSPLARELLVRTRRLFPVDPSVVVLDVSGQSAPFGRYLTPVTLTHPDFGAIDLGRFDTAFAFTGQPWLMDRRLGPGGCAGPCEPSPQPLSPFPFEEYDPRARATMPAGSQHRMLAFYPFAPDDRLDWPPPASAPVGVWPTPPLPPVCEGPDLPAPPWIASVSPPGAMQGAGTVGAILGANFLPGTTCDFGEGVDAACQVMSSTELRVVLRVASDATPGARSVTVDAPGGSATVTGAFQVGAAPQGAVAPRLLSASPDRAMRGLSLQVRLTGDGFLPGMTCDFGSGIEVLSCEPDSAQQAVAAVRIAPDAQPGARLAWVRNPDGLQASLARALEVLGPPPGSDPNTPPAKVYPPRLSAVSPAGAEPGTSLVAVLSGLDFMPGASCHFGAGVVVVSCEQVNATTLVAALEVTSQAALGLREVTVVNPDLQLGQLAGAFEVWGAVQPPPPPPPPPFVTPLFVDQFETLGHGLGALWDTTGHWYRKAGRGRGESAGGVALAQVPVPADHAVEARLQLTGQAQGSGVVARHAHGSFYAVRLRTDGRVQVVRRDGPGETVLDEAPATVRPGDWHRVRLAVSGSFPVRLDVWLDDAPLLTAQDRSPQPLAAGRAGLLNGSDWRTQFDAFRVLAP